MLTMRCDERMPTQNHLGIGWASPKQGGGKKPAGKNPVVVSRSLKKEKENVQDHKFGERVNHEILS